MSVRFSDLFSVRRTTDDDWFDPILTVDTPLFIDPFGIFQDECRLFVGSHDEIVGFFNRVFKLVAQAQGDERHHSYKRALQASFIFRRSRSCAWAIRRKVPGVLVPAARLRESQQLRCTRRFRRG